MTMHHVPPKHDHDSMWLFGKNLMVTILSVKDVLFFGYGKIYSIESHGGVVTVTYELTIEVNLNCTCFDFVSMLANLKNKGKFIPCKHLYFTCKTRMLYDRKTYYDFIN